MDFLDFFFLFLKSCQISQVFVCLDFVIINELQGKINI